MLKIFRVQDSDYSRSASHPIWRLAAHSLWNTSLAECLFVCVCVSSSVPKSSSPLVADSQLFKIPIAIFFETLLIPLHLSFIAEALATQSSGEASSKTDNDITYYSSNSGSSPSRSSWNYVRTL